MTRPFHLASLVASSLVVACGGSPGGPSPAVPPTARAARGAISAAAAGTLTVDGIALDTRGANIKIEKAEHRPESELRIGMVVKVKGSFDDRTGTATEVEFEDQVQGQVDDKTATSVTVGGLVVKVDDTAHFEDDVARLGSIALGDRVRISGFPDDKGHLRASQVQKMAGSGGELQVKGYVSGLSGATFTLKPSPDAAAGLQVTLGAGVTLPAGVADGSLVEVHAAGPAVGGAITATAVSLEDARAAGEGAEVEIEGIVTSGGSGSFQVDGQGVSTSAATRWENGVATDLAPGARVEVEGHIQGGVLLADKVSFRAVVRLQGPVSNAAADSLTVLGFAVSLDEFSDVRVAPVDGQPLQIRGYPSADGSRIVATRTDDATGGGGTHLLLQGVVASTYPVAGTLVVLGVTLSATPATKYYRHQQSTDIGQSAFFALVEAGRSVVKARIAAAPVGGLATAEELELQDEPGTHP